MKRIKALLIVFVLSFSLVMVNRVDANADEVTAAQRNLYQKVFNYNYYAQMNPDVVKAVGNNSQALLDHYITYGVYENRSASEFFNLTAYANRYPELLETFGGNLDAYVQYYVTTGAYYNQNASADDNYLTELACTNITNRMNTLLGYCTTLYNPDIARATNVELAASHINGTILEPGESFSYSKTVGPRTAKNGFVEAPIFIAGQHGTGIGGGICQVSSTLYTAMLNAGIRPTERHAHSLPVSYLPAGYDATISGNYYDLKFKNTFDCKIQLLVTAENGYLTATIVKCID